MYQTLLDYGDRLDTVGIFIFEVDATGTISEMGDKHFHHDDLYQQMTHIKWMLTVMKHGTIGRRTKSPPGKKDKTLIPGGFSMQTSASPLS